MFEKLQVEVNALSFPAGCGTPRQLPAYVLLPLMAAISRVFLPWRGEISPLEGVLPDARGSSRGRWASGGRQTLPDRFGGRERARRRQPAEGLSSRHFGQGRWRMLQGDRNHPPGKAFCPVELLGCSPDLVRTSYARRPASAADTVKCFLFRREKAPAPLSKPSEKTPGGSIRSEPAPAGKPHSGTQTSGRGLKNSVISFILRRTRNVLWIEWLIKPWRGWFGAIMETSPWMT